MIHEHLQWAQQQFGQSDLGEPRRTARLVKLASTLANEPRKPIVNVTLSPADMEGAYRFIRNDNIKAKAIAESGFQATVERAQQHDLLLALEDTPTLIYQHRSIKGDLGHAGRGKAQRGMLAHSILLFSPEEKNVVGLIEQLRWSRDVSKTGQREQHATRPDEEKESVKWQTASESMTQRLQSKMADVISVCDREADIYEYLLYKLNAQQRFVVRSMQSRCIEESEDKLYQFASE